MRIGPRVLPAAALPAGHDFSFINLVRAQHARRPAVEIPRLQPGLPFLATTGAIAPAAIAESQDTSCAVVVPGIAEALFA